MRRLASRSSSSYASLPVPARSSLRARDALQRRSLELLDKLCAKDKYAVFLDPVNTDEVPGYLDVISRRMDLATIRKSVSMGVYRTPMELRADIDLIWSNCIKFNADDTVYYREAVRLRALAGKYFEELLRNLARDGLPFLTRRTSVSGANNIKSSNSRLSSSADTVAQPAGASASGDLSASIISASQRLRNIVRARKKDQLESVSNRPITDAQRAAEAAAARLLPCTERKQIFDGPYQCLRRFPDGSAARLFPYVRGTPFEQQLRPLPPAWRALNRHSCPLDSSASPRERMHELYFAQRYEAYVRNAAPRINVRAMIGNTSISRKEPIYRLIHSFYWH